MLANGSKTLIKNEVRHADTHNRVLEEGECWRQYRTKRSSDWSPGEGAHMDRHDSRDRASGAARGGVFEHDDRDAGDAVGETGRPTSTYWTRQLYKAEDTDPGRWGHGGYAELYPQDFVSTDDERRRSPLPESSSSRRRKSSERKHKKEKKHKKHKKHRKRRRERSSHSESSSNENSDSCLCGRLDMKRSSELESSSKHNSDVCPVHKRKKSGKKRKHKSHHKDSSESDSSDSEDKRKKKKKHKHRESVTWVEK